STPTDPTGSTGADFEFSASEGGSTFECRLDGGAWSACTSPQSYAGLGDGSHTFDVRATDPAGNTDGTPAAFTWLVDTAAPSSTTSFPAVTGEYNSAGWDAGCATSGLCGTYADGTGSGVQTVEVSIRQGSGDYWDGAAFTSASEVWNAATLAAGDWSYALDAADLPADGSYTVRVRATDEAGNAETPSGRTFDYDTTDPSALHSFPAAGGEYSTAGWNAGCATTGFCGTYSDATSGVAQVDLSVRSVASGLYWDGDSFDAAGETFFAAALSGADWSYALPAAGFGADGQYTVHVRATDDAGNTEPGPSRTFRIDDTDPSAVYGFPAPGGTYNVAGWDAGCPAAGLCGTASDGESGVLGVEISLKRVGTDLYW
ncbi:MAG: Ig-like domain-containing protein, partial [Gaiellaceae bacterium]